MSDEYGDYAGDEQNTIRMLMRTCICGGEIGDDECSGGTDTGEHEPLLTERDLEWVVCGTCHGKGTSSLYLGAYTQSEWAEQDDDFREDYLSGGYDRPCPECGGRTTVRQVREGVKHAEEIDEWFRQMYEMRSIQRAERAMGA